MNVIPLNVSLFDIIEERVREWGSYDANGLGKLWDMRISTSKQIRRHNKKPKQFSLF